MKDNIEEEYKPVKLFLLFALFLTLSFAAPYGTLREVYELNNNLMNNVTVFREKSFAVALIFATPLCVMMCYLLFLRIKRFEIKKELLIKWFKLCGVTLAFFFLSMPIYSSYADNKIENKGYSLCPWYGRGSIGAPDIWVRSLDYCQKEGYQVRIKLIDWLSRQKNPSRQEVEFKIDQLLKDRDVEFN